MKVWYGRKDESVVILRIDPYSSPRATVRFSDVISVEKHVDLETMEFGRAQVRWNSSHLETAERALLMAAALRLAARIARQFDKGKMPKYGMR